MSLAKYAQLYKEIQAVYESNFIDPKPGQYTCRVIKGEYKNIQKQDGDEYDQFSWTLEIIEGEHAGQRFKRTDFLTPDAKGLDLKIGFIKGALERCGVCPPANVLDLPIAIDKCRGSEIEVSVVDSGQKTKEGKTIKNIKFIKNLAVQTDKPAVQSGSPDDLSRFDAPEFSSPAENINGIPF